MNTLTEHIVRQKYGFRDVRIHNIIKKTMWRTLISFKHDINDINKFTVVMLRPNIFCLNYTQGVPKVTLKLCMYTLATH